MYFNLFNSLIDELNINTVDFTSDGSSSYTNSCIKVKSNTEFGTRFSNVKSFGGVTRGYATSSRHGGRGDGINLTAIMSVDEKMCDDSTYIESLRCTLVDKWAEFYGIINRPIRYLMTFESSDAINSLGKASVYTPGTVSNKIMATHIAQELSNLS